MSFYRTLLAAVAAVALAAPVFADDTANTTQTPSSGTSMQSTDNSGMQQSTTTTDQSSTATDTKVNLNKASAKELMKVKGLSASEVRAIIAYRKKHEKDGGFKSTSDLANVKGFKKMKADKLQAIEDQLTVD